MQAVFLTIMLLLGLVVGSFSCCQARRLRAREAKKPIKSKWSICEHCGKRLKWYENIPVVSWVLQRGRCRKCGEKIGCAEIFTELLMGGAFVMLGLKFWPEISEVSSGGGVADWARLGVEMILMMALFTLYGILFVYDAMWKVMPTAILWAAVVVAAGYFGVALLGRVEIFSALAAIGVLPGVYFLLYFLSDEKLVGGGDWILALSLALILGNFWLAFVTLFLANFLATIVYLPSLVRKERQKEIAFGPFLILAGVAVFFAQGFILKLVIF
ncbi:prepilin peptidase [Candidatus Saccharibacteria bacterium]|nr:prepilin peptidase [Candidatus Saccharibacteria bacterium]